MPPYPLSHYKLFAALAATGSVSGTATGPAIFKHLLRCERPCVSLMRDGGTFRYSASRRTTALFAFPSVGVAVVRIRNAPLLTSRTSLRLALGWTLTRNTRSLPCQRAAQSVAPLKSESALT